MMTTPCQHQWSPHAEPVGDDTFERCAVCQAIHTTKKSPANICHAAANSGPAYYGRLGAIVEGIPQNRSYTELHQECFTRAGLAAPWGQRRLLEVGSGIGPFVPQFLAWGWEVTCVELDRWAASYLREAFLPIAVHEQDFFQAALVPGNFDALVSCHCLEHFPEADLAFARMVELLAPGGRLYVEVPGQEDIYVHDHWWHLTEATLRAWSASMGLEQVAISSRPRKQHNGVVTDWHLTARRPLKP